LEQLVIDKRYQGLPGVTVGGYLAGLAASDLGPSVAVTLSRAVPTGSAVTFERADGGVRLLVDGELVASAAVEPFQSTAAESISREQAISASKRYPGRDYHLFPDCFTCGPNRVPGDGLRIFPGPVEGRQLVACQWQPPPSVCQPNGVVEPEFLWAALDCPAIWGLIVHGGMQPHDRAVSGRLALHRRAPVRGDAPNVVIGWPIDRQGRKVIAGAAIYGEDGDLLVEARQTMILTDRGVPLNLAAWTRVRA
jgi:hypothetical protein